MKRLKKLNNPKMVSARIEKDDFENFKTRFNQLKADKNASQLTLQDFMIYVFEQFNSGSITIEENTFKLAHSGAETNCDEQQ